MRPSLKTLFLAPALVLAAACSKDKPADPALSNDLSLAAQARTQTTLDSISAVERTNAAAAAAARTAAVKPAPAARTASAPARRRSTSNGTTARSSGTYTPAPQREVTVKNTKRDAAIGAAAGAIIGGASTRSAKGAIIGGAAGAILGGVIGNNVDIQKKKGP
jgi:uncharacterized protein YcfJ